jgi:hypothetical protein
MADHCYDECHYADCQVLIIIMLNVSMLSVIIPNVVVVSVVAPKIYCTCASGSAGTTKDALLSPGFNFNKLFSSSLMAQGYMLEHLP